MKAIRVFLQHFGQYDSIMKMNGMTKVCQGKEFGFLADIVEDLSDFNKTMYGSTYGKVLMYCCIFVWVLSCMAELRRITDRAWALLRLPRGKEVININEEGNLGFTVISPVRLIYALIILLIRTVILGVLGFT